MAPQVAVVCIDNIVGYVYLSAKKLLCKFKQNNQQNVI